MKDVIVVLFKHASSLKGFLAPCTVSIWNTLLHQLSQQRRRTLWAGSRVATLNRLQPKVRLLALLIAGLNPHPEIVTLTWQ